MARRSRADQFTAAELGRARGYRLGLLRSICSESFRDYVEHMWPQIEPTRALIPSVAVDGVCAALQAVGEGRIKRLVICQPPGTGKSLLDAVAFPSWLELRSDGRERVMCGSYSHRFAERDAIKCREVIRSQAYRDLVGGAWGIRGDVGDRFDDVWFTGGGRRVIVSPSTSMGERCTVQVIDDALSGDGMYSASERRKSVRWVAEGLPSRLEDQENDRRVLSGQRLCEDDPPGWAIRAGWKLLNLPAVLDADDAPCELYDDAGVLVWRDPRAPGVPLSSLLSVASLATLRIDMGTLTFSAQYLQRPLPAGGGMFKREWFKDKIVDAAPSGGRAVRGWDLAATAGSDATAATAGVKIRQVGGKFFVEHCRWLQGSAHDVEDAITETAASDGHACDVDIPQDPGQAGKAQKSYLASKLAGYNVHFSPETGSKETRAAPFAAQCEAGNVYLVRGPWLDAWLDEHEGFPAAKLKDRVDATSRAFAALTMRKQPRADLSIPFGGDLD
jgi:predicted phage terminase large subunit-like protein